jgi:repressor LexA
MAPHTPPGKTRERVYCFVRERLDRGLPPTVREVQAALSFRAVQTAREHLERLVSEGRLAKQSGIARGYGLPEGKTTGPPPVLIPVLGRVQAGASATAIEDIEGHIPMRTRTAEGIFGLRIRGESMIGAGIFPGDIVIVRSQPTAESGDIVVALLDDEATIKTLKIRRQRIELHPSNNSFKPIIPLPGHCSIIGKVIEVRRFLEGGLH